MVIDYSTLIANFLPSDLDALRTHAQTAQNESATAASQTAAMMSLNLKLQSSASKNQAKHIELEVKKLEAKETRELLSIVQVRKYPTLSTEHPNFLLIVLSLTFLNHT